MKSTEPWDTIISYWKAMNIPIRQGVSLASIQEFQDKYKVLLPPDFFDYIRIVDGTGINESDEHLSSFLPLAAIRPVHEVLDDSGGVIYPDRFAYPDCYVFVDHFLSSWFYAIQMTADTACAGAVYRVTVSETFGEMEAESFHEFMANYAKDPLNIL